MEVLVGEGVIVGVGDTIGVGVLVRVAVGVGELVGVNVGGHGVITMRVSTGQGLPPCDSASAVGRITITDSPHATVGVGQSPNKQLHAPYIKVGTTGGHSSPPLAACRIIGRVEMNGGSSHASGELGWV